MKKWFLEFKKFAMRGNVMDLAVGVIIGGAFTGIVNSLVNDLLMPVLGLLTGGLDFSTLAVRLGPGEDAAMLSYGNFIAAVINFLLIAAAVFALVKGINRLSSLKKKEQAPAQPARLCPFCRMPVEREATRCPHCTSQLSGQ